MIRQHRTIRGPRTSTSENSSSGSTNRNPRQYLVLGALALFAALPVALALLGRQGRLEQVSVWLGLAGVGLIAGACVAATSAIRGGDLAFAMMVGCHAYWFALPAAQVVFRGHNIGEQAGLPPIPMKNTETALLLVSLFVLASVVSYIVIKRSRTCGRLARATAERLDGSGMRVWPAMLAAVVVGFVPFLVYGGSLGNILSGILGSRSVQRDWVSYAFSSNPLMVAGRAALALSAVLALHQVVRGRGNRMAALAVFVFAFSVTYFDSGTRTWVALMLGPVALVEVRRAIDNRRLAKWAAIGPVLVAGTLWLTEAQRAFRAVGLDSSIADVRVSTSDNDFFTETAIAVGVVPDQFDYVRESVAMLFLTNPIPRSMWPEKPYPRVIQTYGIGRRGFDEFVAAGTSSMPSIVGQFYMSWGWFGAVEAGALIGAIFGAAGSILSRARSGGWAELAAAVVACWAFTSFRVMLPGFHYTPLLLLVCLYLWRAKQRLSHRLEPALGTGR